ncbi:hypothetical protein Tco_0500686 [Tanacetum coccineum]
MASGRASSMPSEKTEAAIMGPGHGGPLVMVSPVMTEAVTTTHIATIPSVIAPESGTKAVTPVHASMFHESESTGMARLDVADNLDASRDFIDHVAPPVLFAQIRDMDYDELFTEFSVGTARQACLSAEVRMQTEYCLSEKRRLEFESEKQASLLKSQDEEIENLKTQLLLKEAEAAEVAHLFTQVSVFEAAEQVHADELNTLKQKNVALEDEKESLNGKVAELQSLVSVKDHELKDVDATVRALEISSFGLQKKVTLSENFIGQLESFQDDRMKMASYLRAAISKDIKKGMQDGLSVGITHGKEGRSLMDVAAYNPSAEVDYVSALQALQSTKLVMVPDCPNPLTLAITETESGRLRKTISATKVGYQQRRQKNKLPKMTKLEQGMEKDSAKIKANSQKVKVKVKTEQITVTTEPEQKNTLRLQSYNQLRSGKAQ